MSIFIFVFAVFIIIAAISSYYYTNSNLKDINKELMKLKTFINNANLELNSLKNLDQIDKIVIKKSSFFKKEWERYYSMIKSQANIEKIIDPAYYFNVDSIINKYSKRSLADSIPGILTGIGIFGTFLGLVIGLWRLGDFNMDVLREQIPVLIDGMKVSFISSLVAIFCSIIWTFFDKRLISKIEIAIEKLNSLLNTILPIRIESNLLEEMVLNQHKQIRATNEFISDTLIPELVNGLKEAVEKTISPEISRMNSTVQRLADVSSDKQAESLDKMVDKFMNSFNETFEYQFDALKETLEEVIVWQKNTKQELEELIGTIEKNAESQNSLLVSTKSLLDNMQNYVSEFDQFHQELKSNVVSLNQITGQLSGIEEQVNKKLSTMIVEYKNLEELKEEEIKRMESQLKEIHSFWASVKVDFNKLNNNLTNSMEQFADNTYKGLNKTFESFDENLAKITKRLGITISSINETVEELPESMTKLSLVLEDFESKQGNIIKQVKSANDKLDKMESENKKGLFKMFGGN